MNALTGNASDEGQVKEAGKREKNAAKQLQLDMKSILATTSGRRILWHYLSFCRIFESIYAEGSHIYFNEGVRNVGLKILADINSADEKAFTTMMTENMENSND